MDERKDKRQDGALFLLLLQGPLQFNDLLRRRIPLLRGRLVRVARLRDAGLHFTAGSGEFVGERCAAGLLLLKRLPQLLSRQLRYVRALDRLFKLPARAGQLTGERVTARSVGVEPLWRFRRACRDHRHRDAGSFALKECWRSGFDIRPLVEAGGAPAVDAHHFQTRLCLEWVERTEQGNPNEDEGDQNDSRNERTTRCCLLRIDSPGLKIPLAR